MDPYKYVQLYDLKSKYNFRQVCKNTSTDGAGVIEYPCKQTNLA